MICPPSPPWVSERQFSPEPNWTPEEDEKLLKLEELCYGRWSQIPHLLSHSPFHCEVRCSQLRDQQMELQDKERKKKRPRTLTEFETRISNVENDIKMLKDQSLKKLKESEEYENQLKLEIANKLVASRDAEMCALEMVARVTEMLERSQAKNEEMMAELRVLAGNNICTCQSR